MAQDFFDEFACVRLLRLIKSLARITSFDFMAAVHENDFGRDSYVKKGQVQVRMTKTASNMHAAPDHAECEMRGEGERAGVRALTRMRATGAVSPPGSASGPRPTSPDVA